MEAISRPDRQLSHSERETASFNRSERLAIPITLTLLIVASAGDIVRRWNGFLAPAELGLTRTHFLGPAPGNPVLEFFSGPDRDVAKSASEFPGPQRGLKP